MSDELRERIERLVVLSECSKVIAALRVATDALVTLATTPGASPVAGDAIREIEKALTLP